MIKTKFSHKVIAVFLTLNFLTTIVPVNQLFANNNGPTAPEASSFEPVDATDMVNLVTGDLSYVLPLLTVPSPEGGYPLALAYHAGIAMDQEASWVGLGWNLNPGAINRSVNGYPDDWKNALIENVLYDAGGEVTDFASTLTLGKSSSSLALSLTYNNNKGFGGSVGFNAGPLLYDSSKGVGVSIGGGFSDSANFSLTQWIKDNKTSLGISVGSNFSVGISFNGDSISISGKNAGGIQSGIGIPFNGIGNSKATVRTSFIGSLSVRLPWWGVNLSYRKSSYSLYDNKDYSVNGVCYPFGINDIVMTDESNDKYLKYGKIFDSNNKVPQYDSYSLSAQGISGLFSPKYIKNTPVIKESVFADRGNYTFADTQYVTRSINDDIVDMNTLADVSMDNDNLHFYFENVHSSYLNIENASQNFDMNLPLNKSITEIENLSSNLITAVSIDGVIKDNYDQINNRNKEGNFIQQFKVSDILNGNASANGYLHSKNPNNNDSYSNIIFQDIDGDAIGGFTVTAMDGKVYHYSLPVYQQEEFIREYVNELDENGNITNFNEEDKFVENRRFTPYATHWLLTAVTGPDYVKNTELSYPSEGDFGYWVRFDYGKWSDGFGWESKVSERKYVLDNNYANINGPRGSNGNGTGSNDRDRDPNSEINIKTYGVKQLYYLNQVKTRTHTALFIKKDRIDNQGKSIQKGASQQNPLIHSNVKKTLNIDDVNVSISDAEFRTFIDVPSQKSLALDKIVLIKNENLINVSPNNYAQQGLNGQIFFEESFDRYSLNGYLGNYSEVLHQRIWGTEFYENILDVYDITPSLLANSVKVIDFSFNATTQNTKNSITLASVNFNGKGNSSIIPPYQFTYNNRAYNEDEEEFHWGFNNSQPDAWSLKEIVTPLGAKIDINYESDSYFPLLNEWCKSRYCQDIIEDREEFLGGGLRVKSISIYENNSLKSKEVYNYSSSENNISSGVSMYTPKDAPLFSDFLPAPQVFYKNVEVISEDANENVIQKRQYKFNVFDLNSIEYKRIASNLGDFFSAEGSLVNVDGLETFQDLGDLVRDGFRNSTVNKSFEIKLKNREFKDNLSSLGQLLSVQTLNSEDQIVNKVENTYKTKDEIVQGKKREGYYYFERNVELKYTYANDPILNVIPNWEQNFYSVDYNYEMGNTYITKYPSVLKTTKSIVGGQSKVNNNKKFDFLTGQLLEVETVDSKGNQFKTEITPAYTKYVGMGSKADGISNKNMLTQEAMNKAYLKVNDQWKETNVGITTWNNDWSYTNLFGFQSTPTNNDEKIWRKHKTFVWDGNLNDNGTFQGYSDTFDWNLEAIQTNEWKQLSETTKYDHFSTPLELTDVNRNKASIKKENNSTKVLASSNAGYGEIFYTGAEYEVVATYIDQQIKMDNGATRTNLKFHTGRNSIEVPVGGRLGAIYRENTYRTGAYKISVWVHKENHENARVKGYPFNGEIIPAGDWVLMNHYITFSTNTGNQFPYITSASGNIYIDDYRVHPLSSSMVSYVYNDWDELSYILNGNNLGTYYEYDSAGRLIRTSEEVIDNEVINGGFKKVSDNNYHYKNN